MAHHLLTTLILPFSYFCFMNGIRNIIFDLGGVILNLDFPKAEQAFAKLGAPGFKELFARGHVNSFIKDYEVGRIDDNRFVDELQRLTGDHHGREEVIAGWNAMLLDFPPERIALLDRLRSKYRIFLFSNTNAIHVEAFKQKFADAFGGRAFEDLFEKAYYSNVINLRKPELAAFQYVIDDSRLHPAETLFIDDMEVNVEGARGAGLQGFHLEPGKTILDIPF